MHTLGIVVFAIGAIIAFISGIQLLIAAFRTSVLWGLGCIFLPVVSLIFVISHWEDAKGPFLRSLLGTGIYVVGVLLMGAGGEV